MLYARAVASSTNPQSPGESGTSIPPTISGVPACVRHQANAFLFDHTTVQQIYNNGARLQCNATISTWAGKTLTDKRPEASLHCPHSCKLISVHDFLESMTSSTSAGEA